MPVKKGNTSTTAVITGYNIPATILSLILSNRSGSAITVSVSVCEPTVYPGVFITGDQFTINAQEAYISNVPIKIMPNQEIYIETSGSLDYYFSID